MRELNKVVLNSLDPRVVYVIGYFMNNSLLLLALSPILTTFMMLLFLTMMTPSDNTRCRDISIRQAMRMHVWMCVRMRK